MQELMNSNTAQHLVALDMAVGQNHEPQTLVQVDLPSSLFCSFSVVNQGPPVERPTAIWMSYLLSVFMTWPLL